MKQSIVKRATAKTPLFFTKLKRIGLTLAAVGGAIIASPFAMPVAVVTAAGYLITAGSVMAAVSQLTTDDEK